MKIQFYGFVHSHSGPAIHGQDFCRALSDEGCDVSIDSHIPKPNWIIGKDIERMFNKPNYDKAITLMLDPPAAWWQHMAERRKALIGLMVFEGSCISYDWWDAMRQSEVDQIWCPSRHTYNSIQKGSEKFDKGYCSEKIQIIPHGVDTNMFNPDIKPNAQFTDSDFTFLYVGGYAKGLADRKGLDIAYKAFCREFSKEEKVKFVAKVTSIYNPQGYNPADVLRSLDIPKDHATFRLITQDFGRRADLANLYKCADVFVAPSKAEAFNMPILEAMACGVPAITSSYGGQTDYVSEENGWLLKDLKEIDATDFYIYDWAKWKAPSETELRKKMRYCFENKEEVKVKGTKAAETAKQWTWKSAAEKAVSLLKEFE